MSAAIASAVLANLASNAMADAKAETAYDREQQLMRQQNRMNQHNALMAYTTQVQGAKLAGLSPAMLNGSTPQVAAPVTKGSAPVAENVEFDPASLLMDAQAENLRAQTEKTEAETAKIKGVDTESARADIDLKIAQKLYTGANQSKVEEESKQLRNINQVFAEENSAMGLFGQTTAQEWQKSPWFEKLPSGAKMVISDIARGEMDLTVGIVNALDRAVATDSHMSKLQMDKVHYSFQSAILDAQFSDKSIMDAIARAPKSEQEHLKASKDKIIAETDKIKYKMQDFLDTELAGKKLSNEQLNAAVAAFKRNDLGYLKSQGEYGKWLEGYAEEMLLRLLPLATGGALAGKFSRQGGESTQVKTSSETTSPPIYHPDGSILKPKETTQGVHTFWR